MKNIILFAFLLCSCGDNLQSLSFGATLEDKTEIVDVNILNVLLENMVAEFKCDKLDSLYIITQWKAVYDEYSDKWIAGIYFVPSNQIAVQVYDPTCIIYSALPHEIIHHFEVSCWGLENVQDYKHNKEYWNQLLTFQSNLIKTHCGD